MLVQKLALWLRSDPRTRAQWRSERPAEADELASMEARGRGGRITFSRDGNTVRIERPRSALRGVYERAALR